jgi:hypothetical protein
MFDVLAVVYAVNDQFKRVWSENRVSVFRAPEINWQIAISEIAFGPKIDCYNAPQIIAREPVRSKFPK